MTRIANYNQLIEDLSLNKDLEVNTHPSERKRFSRDFFNYSPILFEKQGLYSSNESNITYDPKLSNTTILS